MTIALTPQHLVTALTPLLGLFDEIANLREELRVAVDAERRTQLHSLIANHMAELRSHFDRTADPL